MGSSPIGRPTATPALILAGGEARRMGGGDKPLLKLAGRTLLAHVIERLAADHARLAIGANGDPARFAAFGLPVLPDPAPGLGPLGGLLAGLDWASSLGSAWLLTVPGDGPFLPRGLVRLLAPGPAIAASLGRDHPTVGLWPVDARARLREHLAATADAPRRMRGVRRFADAIGARRVAFPPDEGGTDPFADVDTPDDLARAEARLAGAGAPRC